MPRFASRSRPVEMRVITTRHNGHCAESGEVIPPGHTALWCPRSRVLYSLESATYSAWLDGQSIPAADGPRFDRFDCDFEDRCRDACGL